MTLSEFKAWFEGFSEGIEIAPTAAQFDKIKAKVAEINGVALTREVIVERYRDVWPDYWRRPYWSQPYASYSAGAASMGKAVGNAVLMNHAENFGGVGTADGQAKEARDQYLEMTAFNSHAAMRAIGMAEANAA